MVNRPLETNSFEFIAVAALRTKQLMRGCVPRVPMAHKLTTTAQLEVVAGKVFKLTPEVPPAVEPSDQDA
jgi:DNA-directed RNA polymerase subunit K/omega